MVNPITIMEFNEQLTIEQLKTCICQAICCLSQIQSWSAMSTLLSMWYVNTHTFRNDINNTCQNIFAKNRDSDLV